MVKLINWKLISRITGMLILFEAALLLVASLVSLCYFEYDWEPLFLSTGITVLVGGGMVLLGKGSMSNMGPRESHIIVTLIWLIMSVFGMLPFWLSGAIPDFTNAMFETVSGLTTTGSTILNNIEEMPHGLLLWRSIMQWIGGLGVVVLSLVVLPFISSGKQLYMAEMSGFTYKKVAPRLRDTGRRLMRVYLVITVAAILSLWVCGMSFFDAVCHALTTVSSGGFSTRQSSIAAWNSPLIEYVTSFYMVVSGVSFVLLFWMMFRGEFKKSFQDEELRAYLIFMGVVTLVLTVIVCLFPSNSLSEVHSLGDVERNFRHVLFQVTSTMTSTGLSSFDYLSWPPIVWMILVFLLMVIGGSAGSTAGGMKVARILVVGKLALGEMKHRIHPNAVIPITINRHPLDNKLIRVTHNFFVFYLGIMLFGAFLMVANGVEPFEALCNAITSISNAGPSVGQYGPVFSFSALPDFSKWVMMLLMLVGRLEIFTFLIILTPALWKR